MSQNRERDYNDCEPLLQTNTRAIQDPQAQSTNDVSHSSEDETSSIDEDVLDHVVSVFGTSVGVTTGLDAGAPPLRRFSVGGRLSIVDNRRIAPFTLNIGSETERRKSYSTFKTGPFAQPTTIEVENVEDVAAEASVMGGQTQPKSKFNHNLSTMRFWAIFGSILLLYFVALFDATLMASSHPVITSYFNSSNSASWLSTSFLLTSTAFQPSFGRISDILGRKPIYLFCLATFTLGTLWCQLAPSILSFIAARAVCGLGAGGAVALGMIVISDMVPLEIRGKYLAWLNIAFGVGSSAGAALGGFLADTIGWRWEFGIQVPVMAFCWLAAWFTMPADLGLDHSTPTKANFTNITKSFDVGGSVFLTVLTSSILLALNLGGNLLPWTHPVIISAFGLVLLAAAGLYWAERKAAMPILPLEILLSSPRANLVLANFLASITMNTILFNIPLFFQVVLLDTPTLSGIRLIPPFLFNTLSGLLVGYVLNWSQRLRLPNIVGLAFILAGSIMLSVMKTSYQSWIYVTFLVLCSVGQGFAYPSLTLSMLATSSPADVAVATGALILWRSLGTVMGVCISSMIVQNSLLGNLDVYVSGPEKKHVIELARSSVEQIRYLDQPYQSQVIAAYASSLRLAFIFTTVTAVLSLLSVSFIKLPRLGNKKFQMQADE